MLIVIVLRRKSFSSDPVSNLSWMGVCAPAFAGFGFLPSCLGQSSVIQIDACWSMLAIRSFSWIMPRPSSVGGSLFLHPRLDFLRSRIVHCLGHCVAPLGGPRLPLGGAFKQ